VKNPDQTVFILWGGANDYLSKEPFTGDIGTLLDRPASRAGYRRIVAETVAGLTGQVKRLHAAGARRFVVVTLPDLGRTPIVLHNDSYQPQRVRTEAGRRIQLSRRLSHLTAYHNTALTRSMRRLSRQLKGAKIVVADANGGMERVLRGRSPNGRHAFDYGFVADEPGETIRTRRATIRAQDRCYEGGYLGTSDPRKVCHQAPKVFFWDTVHPSSFAHCWISWLFQNQLMQGGLLAQHPSVQEGKSFCLRAIADGSPNRSTPPGPK
jgi:phospholipase/lecithinase/hemolysin